MTLRPLPSLLLCATAMAGHGIAEAQVFTEPPRPAPTARPAPRPRPAARPRTPRQPPVVAQSLPPEGPGPSLDEPVDYCTTYPDMDFAGPKYTGPRPATWMAAAAWQVFRVPSTEARDEAKVVWRCMDGRVHICYRAAGASCSKSATAGASPDADRRGFSPKEWFDISRFAPSAAVGQTPGQYIGRWTITAEPQTSGILPNFVRIELTGGGQGGEVGKITYARPPRNREATLICETPLVLTSVREDSILLSQPSRRGASGPCSADRKIAVSADGARLWFRWGRERPGTGIQTILTGWSQ